MCPTKTDIPSEDKATNAIVSMENGGATSGHFFEGVEKLLEVWFKKESGDIHQGDLRKIPR